MTDLGPLALPDAADIRAASARIAPHIRRTELLTSPALDSAAGARLVFKAEPLQPPGSFKVRGAVNAVFALGAAEAARGVATHSSGNHGMALAYAAARRGIPCHVVMPRGAARAKVEGALAYGARVVACAPGMAARQAALEAVLAATGAVAVHPFDDSAVIAGQATCTAELLADAPDLDTVLVPVGGGGLMAGACLARDAAAPGLAVWGAEPAQADDARRGLQAGTRLDTDAPDTIADGLRASLSPRTFAAIAAGAAGILTATEAQIASAMRLSWERLKLTIEPSCAVPLAAILAAPETLAGRRVGVVLTGGNVDLDALPWRA